MISREEIWSSFKDKRRYFKDTRKICWFKCYSNMLAMDIAESNIGNITDYIYCN